MARNLKDLKDNKQNKNENSGLSTAFNHNKASASVLIIYTGGTIGMTKEDPNNSESPLIPSSISQFKNILKEYVPKLGIKEKIFFEVRPLIDEQGREVEPIDSSDINSGHWNCIADVIKKAYNEKIDKKDRFDGFVILHGTDTMTYTASALSFMLSNLSKPVVLTGSQLPIIESRTDAIQNLVNAIYIAGYKAVNLDKIPEVSICFGSMLLRGNRSRKTSSLVWKGFESPNYPKLATFGEDIKVDLNYIKKAEHSDLLKVDKITVTDVMDLSLFPGINEKHLESILKIPNLKGLILRTYGAGNAPSSPGFLNIIKKAINGELVQDGKKIPRKIILNITQCLEGKVKMGLYEASTGLVSCGVKSGADMTPEAALTKMMWQLSIEKDLDIVADQLQVEKRGEQSNSSN